MREQPGLFGEILSRPEVRSEIIEIAWREAENRRVEEEEIARKHPRLDGTVATCRGYAIYRDFEQYIKQRMEQEELKVSGWDLAKVKFYIRDILCEDGWEHQRGRGRREARFYPPGAEPPNSGRSQHEATP